MKSEFISALAVLCFALLANSVEESQAKSETETKNYKGYLVKFKSTRALQDVLKTTTMSTAGNSEKVEVISDQLLKVSSKWIESAQALRNRNIEYIQPDYDLGFIEDFRVNDPQQQAQIIEYLKTHPEALGANSAAKNKGDNPAIPIATTSQTAKDPLLNKQWGMIDIEVPQVWAQVKNNKTIIVGVIDSGVDYTHPDLLPNMWRNPGEIGIDSSGRDRSTNRIDDDKNGYVDDVVGYDFVHNDAFPYDKATPAWQLALGGGNPGHGTHCAGNIAAKSNNGLGISGVAPNAQIMALRFIAEKGGGQTSGAIKAIRYGVDNGAKVLNNSWGSIGENPNDSNGNKALREAVQYAESKGVLFIAAAGNGLQGKGYDNDTSKRPAYPASYPYSNIVSVAAIDSKDNLGTFSNWGVKSVHIAAPGVKVFSTTVGAKYSDQVIPFLATWDGTSMAAPHVAGAAALYWAQYPDKTMLEVKEALIKSATSIPSLQNKTVSGGKLNLMNLLKYN